jgi:hypothetical protein
MLAEQKIKHLSGLIIVEDINIMYYDLRLKNAREYTYIVSFMLIIVLLIDFTLDKNIFTGISITYNLIFAIIILHGFWSSNRIIKEVLDKKKYSENKINDFKALITDLKKQTAVTKIYRDDELKIKIKKAKK